MPLPLLSAQCARRSKEGWQVKLCIAGNEKATRRGASNDDVRPTGVCVTCHSPPPEQTIPRLNKSPDGGALTARESFV